MDYSKPLVSLQSSCTLASGAQPLVLVQEVVGLAAALLLLSTVAIVKAQVVVEAEELTCLGHVQEADFSLFLDVVDGLAKLGLERRAHEAVALHLLLRHGAIDLESSEKCHDTVEAKPSMVVDVASAERMMDAQMKSSGSPFLDSQNE